MEKNERSSGSIGIALVVTVLIGALVSWAGSDNSAYVGAVPVFALCGFLAFSINWLVFIPSSLAKTEHFYDLTGSITYLTVISVALFFTPGLDTRSKLVALMVAVWALRLGTFLFLRIRHDGKDDRFDQIKVKPLRFFFAWTVQGLWVLFTAACALAIITSNVKTPIGIFGVVGIAIWLFGFSIEVVADAQKRAFRRKPENDGKFINVGLWSWSRHPNYFGEIVLWAGVAIIALPVLSGWQWMTLISPLFVFLLLTRLSGIPMLKKKAQARWGDDPAYQAYLKNTSELVPWPPRGT